MKRAQARWALTHQFVEFIPEQLQEGVLYVSMAYATAAHRCFCGCGREVVTPFSPTDWKLTFDGEALSLSPSIGNWSFPCKSHYWIKQNRVQWCGEMPQEMINIGRARDRLAKANYYGAKVPQQNRDEQLSAHGAGSAPHAAGLKQNTIRTPSAPSLLSRLLAWLKKAS